MNTKRMLFHNKQLIWWRPCYKKCQSKEPPPNKCFSTIGWTTSWIKPSTSSTSKNLNWYVKNLPTSSKRRNLRNSKKWKNKLLKKEVWSILLHECPTISTPSSLSAASKHMKTLCSRMIPLEVSFFALSTHKQEIRQQIKLLNNRKG